MFLHRHSCTKYKIQTLGREYGTSLTVQLLRFCTSNAGFPSSGPGWGINIPHVVAKKKK